MKTDYTPQDLSNLVALGQLQRQRKKINFVEKFQRGQQETESSKSETIEINDESDLEEREKEILNLPEYDSVDKGSGGASTSKAAKSKPSNNSKSSSSDAMSIKAKHPEATTLQKINISKINYVDAHGFVHVYTDGACQNNGKYSAAAGLGVYFAEGHHFNTSEPVKGRPTNNSGEIQAAIRAIEIAEQHDIKRLKIFTDSQFLINAACFWIKNWKKKDWKLSTGRSVVNKKDFQSLDNLIEKGNMLIEWRYIPAHKGHHGNEEADKLAKEGASRYMTKREKEMGDDYSDESDDHFWSG